MTKMNIIHHKDALIKKIKELFVNDKMNLTMRVIEIKNKELIKELRHVKLFWKWDKELIKELIESNSSIEIKNEELKLRDENLMNVYSSILERERKKYDRELKELKLVNEELVNSSIEIKNKELIKELKELKLVNSSIEIKNEELIKELKELKLVNSSIEIKNEELIKELNEFNLTIKLINSELREMEGMDK